jgi:hypothetical protein
VKSKGAPFSHLFLSSVSQPTARLAKWYGIATCLAAKRREDVSPARSAGWSGKYHGAAGRRHQLRLSLFSPRGICCAPPRTSFLHGCHSDRGLHPEWNGDSLKGRTFRCAIKPFLLDCHPDRGLQPEWRDLLLLAYVRNITAPALNARRYRYAVPRALVLHFHRHLSGTSQPHDCHPDRGLQPERRDLLLLGLWTTKLRMQSLEIQRL